MSKPVHNVISIHRQILILAEQLIYSLSFLALFYVNIV
jgi:hypothetical protein